MWFTFLGRKQVPKALHPTPSPSRPDENTTRLNTAGKRNKPFALGSTGLYQKLDDNRKKSVDKIIGFLERGND